MTLHNDTEFHAYYNIADEMSDGYLAITDFKVGVVRDATKAAARLDLPWPPVFAVAEAYVNHHVFS